MTERRTRGIFALLLVAQLVLITAQASSSAPEPTAVERGLFRIIAPVAGMVHRISALPGRTLQGFRRQRSLLEENRRLREQVLDLRLEMVRLQGMEGEVKRLAEALDYASPEGLGADRRPLQVADVVYADHRPSLRVLILRVREGSEVHPNQPVVAAQGLVGRVIFVSGSFAKVQLITDRAAAVAAMIERTRRQGVLRGSQPRELKLELVPLQANVRPDDRVLTSGLDGVYPRGILVGTVVSVRPSEDLFHLISVRPAVELSLLDQVYLLPTEPIPESLLEEPFGATP